jgi:hypothetical protein
MKIFKDIVYIINKTIGMFGLGFGIGRMLYGDYELASWILLSVLIFFVIGYFTERLSRGERYVR